MSTVEYSGRRRYFPNARLFATARLMGQMEAGLKGKMKAGLMGIMEDFTAECSELLPNCLTNLYFTCKVKG